jgi:NADPH-dependent ferric siderophore reductase
VSTPESPSPPRRGPRLLHVVGITDITPRMRRITLGGEELAGFPSGRQGSHVKVFVPRPGQIKPELPTLGPAGPSWPSREVRPFTRTYTIRSFRADVGELDLDFVLHGDHGPASAWASKVQLGDFLGIAGPGGRGPIPQDAEWYLFVGDETALPAISAHLETLPATSQGVALIEVANAREEQTLAHPPGVQINWLHRNGVAAGHSSLLIDAVRQLTWPAQSIFAFVAAEAKATAAVRSYLRHECHLPRQQIHSIPYWKVGQDEDAYHDERHKTMDRDEVD